MLHEFKSLFNRIRTHPFLFFTVLIVVTRLIYVPIGIYSRDYFLDKNKPFPSWTYNSKYEALNIWTVWDSGFYKSIATSGYPRNQLDKKNATTIMVRKNTYDKVSLPYADIDGKYKLPHDNSNELVTNVLFLIGSQKRDEKVELRGIMNGSPYCVYRGPIDYTRSVLVHRESLIDKTSCGSQPCNKVYLTYYNLETRKVEFQEFLDLNHSVPVTTFGHSRPDGFTNERYAGEGCSTIKNEDLVYGKALDYTKVFSIYPFLPLYPYLVKLVSFIFKDIILSGVFLSISAFILSAIIFYKLLRLDFDEDLAFYSAIFYIIFPFNFILGGFFTESLFNLLLFSVLYLAKIRKYLLAILLVPFMFITRLNGFVVLFLLIPIFFRQIKDRRKRFLYSSLLLLSAPTLLLAHICHLYTLTGDWFVIINAEKSWNRIDSNVISRLISYLLDLKYVAYFELIVFLVSLAIVIYTVKNLKTKSKKKFPIEYVIYSLLAFGIPLISGVFQSFPRYTLTLFPIYIGLSFLSRKLNARLWFIIISSILSCVFMGVWVLSTNYII